MQDIIEFLSGLKRLPWSPSVSSQLKPMGLFLGQGSHAMEVIVGTTTKAMSSGEIRRVWKDRNADRAAPLILVILHSGQASVCGPAGEVPNIYPDLNPGQVERLCRELLDQPDRESAHRLFDQTKSSFRTTLPGLRNEGLLALHELEYGVPKRADLIDANRRARATQGLRGHELLKALGFSIEPLDSLTSVLRSNDRKTALAVMLHENETVELKEQRFNQLSPVNYAFRKADNEDLKWIIFTQENRIRLYATDLNVGVGRRGRTDTYIECQPWLLSDDQLHYLWFLFSAEALAPDGSLYQILEGSTRFAGDLAKRLRERIYERVVPTLAQGIIQAREDTATDPEELALTYEMAITVLFRLLFIAYAEDRDLLPYQHNDAYRRRSLKMKAQELANAVRDKTPIAEGSTHWQETVHLFEAIVRGNSEWGVPAYGGALFLADEEISKAGAMLSKITLPNDCFEIALRDLLVTKTREGLGAVDFRSLGVREFGTIYEGLLESGLARADMDLVLKKQKNGEVFVPAKEGEIPVIFKDEAYLHNRSGARKSSGSYYTKPFAVDHLLEGALRPALKDHYERLNKLDETDTGEAFFDFRVADIAMGSGHFLIGAIDLMEQEMADYLASRPLPAVMNELAKLRSIALNRLSETGQQETIEDSQLLRRLIARRCIYGVDINPLAVQLSRLAVWIHTFVPGLPLSFLDRTLIQGNALVGMGTIAEIRNAFEKYSVPLFNLDPQKLLGLAEKPLQRIKNNNDSSLEDVKKARIDQDDIRVALRNSIIFCDLLTAASISDAPAIKEVLDEWEKFSDSSDNLQDPQMQQALDASREVLEPLSVVHFPIAFPEVFLRTRPGFDVILGNPPWEKVKVEQDAFWARHFPGLRGKPQREQEAEKMHLQTERPDLVALYEHEIEEMKRLRQALVSGAYPGIGSGDPDLYKAFCWRFWRLSCTNGGFIGVVLPRSALTAKGSMSFRKTIFSEVQSIEITTLKNRAGWVFSEVTSQYTISLVSAKQGKPTGKTIHIQGPYNSLADLKAIRTCKFVSFTIEEVQSWNDTVSLPLLPRTNSIQVFSQLRKSHRLDLKSYSNHMGGAHWRARPDAELHPTKEKPLMDLVSKDCPDGYWPVYKGASINLWTPDTGTYYAWADPEPVLEFLQSKRKRAGNNRRSVHSEFSLRYRSDPTTLPCHNPRIAFRDVARATDPRTVLACLLPPNVFLTGNTPYFLWPNGDEKDIAFLLGILTSTPLDWYARCFVETHVTLYLMNSFPIPRPARENRLWKRVVELSSRLACPDDRFAEWAEKVGVQCGPIDEAEKEYLIHELDAVVAHLYGLSESQLIHIFETFHETWDYESRLQGVLRHFKTWRGKL